MYCDCSTNTVISLQDMSLTECETKLSYLDILVTIENGKYYNFTIVYLSSIWTCIWSICFPTSMHRQNM